MWQRNNRRYELGNSATLIANIDQFILEHGYGCDAELIPGDTMPTGTSMIEKGQPDVAPELWSNSLKDALDKGVQEKRPRYAGKALVNGGEEGFGCPPAWLSNTQKWQPLKASAKTLACLNTQKTQIHLHFIAAQQVGTVKSVPVRPCFEALDLEESGFTIVIQARVPAYLILSPKLMNVKKLGLVITGHPPRC